MKWLRSFGKSDAKQLQNGSTVTSTESSANTSTHFSAHSSARNSPAVSERFVAMVTIVVADYDEAINYYVNKLGFALVEDSALDENRHKRWVVLACGSHRGARLLLAKADGADQVMRIGSQCANRVALFLQTDNFARDFESFSKAGVKFLERPRHETYGTVAVFSDVYGNRWDLIQLNA